MVAGLARQNDGTPRVEQTTSEQQDRLAEQQRSGVGGSARTPQPIEHQQHRPSHQHRVVEVTRGDRARSGAAAVLGVLFVLGDEPPETNKLALARHRRRRDHRPVPDQDHQIQVAGAHPLNPFAHPRSGDIVLAGDLGDGDALGHLPSGLKDIADVVGFAWQQIVGQDALAATTRPAASKPDRHWPEVRARLHAPRDPAARQLKVGAAAPGAHAPRQDSVVCVFNDGLVAATIDVKYVRQHVPRRLRGKKEGRSRHHHLSVSPASPLSCLHVVQVDSHRCQTALRIGYQGGMNRWWCPEVGEAPQATVLKQTIAWLTEGAAPLHPSTVGHRRGQTTNSPPSGYETRSPSYRDAILKEGGRRHSC
jgi:hypothetical protein